MTTAPSLHAQIMNLDDEIPDGSVGGFDLAFCLGHRAARHAAAELALAADAEIARLAKIEADWMALSQDDGKAQREIERLTAELAIRHPRQHELVLLVGEHLRQRDDARAELAALRSQEPVACYADHRLTPEGTTEFYGYADKKLKPSTMLYAAPAPAVPLTLDDERILAVMRENPCRENDWADHIEFARAILAAAKGTP